MLLQKKQRSKQTLLSKLYFCLLLCLPVGLNAELKELDDKKLDEQTAKAGITIDISYKLSIKQILFDYSDRASNSNSRKTELAPPPPRIEYFHGND